MVKEVKAGDQDEVESLMREVQDNPDGRSTTSGMKDTIKGSSTATKVLVLILIGLLALFATDSIELKMADKGALPEGDVQERFPTDGDAKNKKPAKIKDNTPVAHENETPRYAYKNRGQPMPDDMAKEQTDKWGEWKPMTKERPQHDFYEDYPNRDVPRTKFPSNAWQLDKVYMKEFLTQGKDLVMRAMEAILAEYGHGVDDEPGASFATRSAMFNLRRYDVSDPAVKFDKVADGGWTTDRSWEGLKRRLLHAVMTEDSFNFAMAGHSAAAGHG
jgi:hypothetical protein